MEDFIKTQWSFKHQLDSDWAYIVISLYPVSITAISHHFTEDKGRWQIFICALCAARGYDFRVYLIYIL